MAASHLKRRVEIGKFLLKYRQDELVHVLDLDEAALFDDAGRPDGSPDPEEFARDLERMGPTFIKAGQLLSTRPDLLSPPYLDALSRLQDDVEPFDGCEAARIVEDELHVRLSKGFRSFDLEPLAAASLAQVHAAELPDGRSVVVKIQRPGIRAEVLEDFEVLTSFVRLASDRNETLRQLGIEAMFADFKRSMLRELDFRREAKNLQMAAELLSEHPLLVVPKPIPDYSTSRVLTMERLEGKNVGHLTPLARIELDGEALAEALVNAYLDLVLVHGVFNADPHPGNLLVMPDGRLGLVDMGMVTYLTPAQRDDVLRLLLALGGGDSDEVAHITEHMGQPLEGFDRDAFQREIAEIVLPNHDASFAEVDFGRIVLEMTRASARCRLRPAPELALLGKTLLNLDEATRLLAPDLQPRKLVEEHATSLMRKHLLHSISPAELFDTALETNQFLQSLPGRLNTIMGNVADGRFEVKLHAFDEDLFLSNMQKIANRITLGLVVAALIVGAALLTRVPAGFQVFGYPGLAMILFLIAAATGFALVATILFTDKHGD